MLNVRPKSMPCALPRNEAEQLEITRQQLETAKATTIAVLRDEMKQRKLWERRVGGLELQLAQANYELYQVKQETSSYALHVKRQVLDFLDTLHYVGTLHE
jgi:hypothetical protein